MNRRHRSLSLLALNIATLTPAAIAQSAPLNVPPNYINQDVYRGMHAALPVGISIASQTGPEAIFAKREGDRTTPPMAWGPNSERRATSYDPALLFPDPVLRSLVSINAWSTGNDFLPHIDATGRILVFSNWVSISVSFTNSSGPVLEPVADLIAQRHARMNPVQGRTTPGADIYSYYLPGSIGISQRLVGNTVVEQAAEHNGVGPQDEIDAIDYGMGIFSFEGAQQSNLVYRNRNEIYFSLSANSAMQINTHFAGSNIHFAKTGASGSWVASVDAATVYKMDWNPDVREWSAPYVYRTSELMINGLGEPTLNGDYDVDALAVDSAQGYVVFSTALGNGTDPLPSQLMVSRPLLATPHAGPTSTLVLKDGNDDRIGGKVGSGDDTTDIDATCISDPEAFDIDTHLGTSLTEVDTTLIAQILPTVQLGDPLGISVARVGSPLDANGYPSEEISEEFFVEVTGRSTPGSPGGALHYFVGFGPGSANNVLPNLDNPATVLSWNPLPPQAWNPTVIGQTGSSNGTLRYPIDPENFAGWRFYFAALYIENGGQHMAFSLVNAIQVE